MALGLVREPKPKFMSNLFGTPPLAQQLGDDTMERLVTHQASRPQRPGSPLSAQPLRRGRQVATTTISVAAKLPRHRRGRPAQLVGDVAHTHTRTVQISDCRPFGQRQISRMPRLGCCESHWRIVHRLTGSVEDCAPVPPACSRPAIDSHDPARLGVTHPLRSAE